MTRENVLTYRVSEEQTTYRTKKHLVVMLDNGVYYTVKNVASEWGLQAKREYATTSVVRTENDTEDRFFGLNVNGDASTTSSSLQDKELGEDLYLYLLPFEKEVDELLKEPNRHWVVYDLERDRFLCKMQLDVLKERFGGEDRYLAFNTLKGFYVKMTEESDWEFVDHYREFTDSDGFQTSAIFDAVEAVKL